MSSLQLFNMSSQIKGKGETKVDSLTPLFHDIEAPGPGVNALHLLERTFPPKNSEGGTQLEHTFFSLFVLEREKKNIRSLGEDGAIANPIRESLSAGPSERMV